MAVTKGFLGDASQTSGKGPSFNPSMYANYPGARKPAAQVQPGANQLPSQILKALGMTPQAAQQMNAALIANKYSQGAGYAPMGAASPAATAAGTGGTPQVAPTSPNQQGGQVMNGGGNFTTSSTPSASVNSVATPLTEQNTDPVDWRFNGSDRSFSQRDLEGMMNDPYRFQREFLSSRGMNTPGANAALGQYASRVNPLAFAMTAGGMSPEQNSDLEDLAGVYEGLMSNYITPGGRMPDVAEIMNTLLSQGSIGNDQTATNLLQSVIAGQDPEGQGQAINQILGAALAGAPGMFGTGWSNMLDQSLTGYLDSTSDYAQGPDASYLGYLQNDPFWSRLATGR
jgi:hypothetical protein